MNLWCQYCLTNVNITEDNIESRVHPKMNEVDLTIEINCPNCECEILYLIKDISIFEFNKG